MVVANFSLISGFFQSRKCRCLRGLFEREKFCLIELSQSQKLFSFSEVRIASAGNLDEKDNGVIILNLR